jgi:hypothetical protein
MVMTRFTLFAFALGFAAATAACNKPSEEDCRKALTNMRELIGSEGAIANADVEGDVRRCKGGSTRKAVKCAMEAKTLADLRACDFMKVPDKAGEDAGSAAPAGSAAAGSAAAGSATP